MEEKINNSLSCFLFQLFFLLLAPLLPQAHGQTKRDKIIECLSLLFEKKKDWHAMCLLSRHIQGKIPIFKRPFTMDFQYKEGH